MAPARANPTLPDDLLTTEIVPRLTPKSIGRFRCASKPWRRLLSSSKFIKTHLQRHIKDPEQILLRTIDGTGTKSINLSSRSVSRPVPHQYTELGMFHMGPSCHGLVLALLRYKEVGKIHVVLMNAVTRESVNISNPFNRESAVSRYGLGLGYDKASDDYKVVSVLRSGKAEVYSVRAKKWKKIAAGFPFSPDLRHRNGSGGYKDGVYVDGFIYWAARGHLASFDPTTEEFKEVQLPSDVQNSSFDLCVLDGFLGLGFREARVYHVWVMKENGDGEPWTNVASIEYPEGHVDGQIAGREFRVVCLHGDELVTRWDSDKFFSYNLKSEKWGYLEIADDELFSYKDQVTPFRGSLVSLDLLRRNVSDQGSESSGEKLS